MPLLGRCSMKPHRSSQPHTSVKPQLDIALEEFDHIHTHIYPAEIRLIDTYFKEILKDILSGESGE